MKTNIIGVNGKIGSGKDTVGRIIQYLVANKNLPKNMQYYSLEELDNGVESYSNWEIKKFAGKLKLVASLLSGVPVEMWEDQEFKKQYMPEEWNSFVSIDFPKMTGEEIKNSDSILVETTYKRMTYREFLQNLGTEAMRDGLHTNVWVNALFADYKPSWKFEGEGIEIDDVSLIKDYPNWIITDMRFPNEMEAIKQRGGITIRIDRLYTTTGGNGIPATFSQTQFHPSETALDDATFDYTIDNNGTIEELIEKVKQILIKEQIL